MAFYARYAGLVVARERDEDGTRVVRLAERAEDPDFVFVLIPMAHSEGERPGVHHFGFSVASRDEVDAIAARVRSDGVLREEPRDARVRWSATSAPSRTRTGLSRVIVRPADQ